MKQISIALVIAVLAVAMITSVTFSQQGIAQQIKEGKIQVKSNNVDIQIIGGEGKQGKPGKDGVDGKDGINGTNGKDGLQGIQGIQGEPGLPGKDGVNGTSLPEETINIINDVVALYKNGSLNVNICYFQDSNSQGECPPTEVVDNSTGNETGPVVVPPVDNQTNTDNNQTEPLPPVNPPVIDNSTGDNTTDVIIIPDNGTNVEVIENNTNTNSTPVENNTNTQENETGLIGSLNSLFK